MKNSRVEINFKFIWILAITLLFLHVAHVISECNSCSPGQYACVSDNQYALCTNGTPNLSRISVCPEGTGCSTFGEPICQDVTDELYYQDCKGCNACNVNRTFACIGKRTFALCLGLDTPSEAYIGTCAANSVCNANYEFICANSSVLVTPTCPVDITPTTPITTTTTTPAPPTTPTPNIANPSAYCEVIQEEGRFPMGSNPATTCHQYVSCIQIGQVWRGAVYICPGNSYFDSANKICVPNPPPRCSSNVRSLSLLDIELD